MSLIANTRSQTVCHLKGFIPQRIRGDHGWNTISGAWNRRFHVAMFGVNLQTLMASIGSILARLAGGSYSSANATCGVTGHSWSARAHAVVNPRQYVAQNCDSCVVRPSMETFPSMV